MSSVSGCTPGSSPDAGLANASGSPVSLQEVQKLMDEPLLELVFQAAEVHRRHHDPRKLQCAQLLSIKTGGCPEDCGYCSQSAHYDTIVDREPLMELDQVLESARRARDGGADRFCMGAAWRQVRDGAEFDRVIDMVKGVKALGLETCATLGMVTEDQARRLGDAGLDYYNHNLDTGRSFYDKVVTTRNYDDRLRTLEAVREAGVKVCCGGIVGLGEDRGVRAEFLAELAAMDPAPESVPINMLVAIDGTPMADEKLVDWSELVRTVAAARILLPTTALRLSAGRLEMQEAVQALCFLAGANSIFLGDHLLTTPNPDEAHDTALLSKLGLVPLAQGACKDDAAS
ncbi:MAG: biotin synthase BioB [Planctomycetota bacterium]|nr:biotin synthase BioB [Planctomycetota bacterium]